MLKRKQKGYCVWIMALFMAFVLTATVVAQVKITLWYPSGGKEASDRYDALEKAFSATHPDIKLDCVYAKGSETDVRKLITAIAGGVAPDVAMIDRFTVSGWALTGSLTALEEYVEKAGIKKEDYYSYAWGEAEFAGHLWAMPTGIDSWELFYWNKDSFREIGADPDKPPVSVKTLDEINPKFFKYDAAGRVTETGYLPWVQCGHLVAYGRAWAWGGSFYDVETGKITANHPRNVEYWNWLAVNAEKYPVEEIEGMRKVFGKSPATNPFYTGREAAMIQGSWMGPSLERYAPDLNWGVATSPFPPGGRKDCTGGGGWSYMMPKGTKNPEEAFEVIRWLTSEVEAWKIALEHGDRAYPAFKKAFSDPDVMEEYFSDEIAKVGLTLLYSPNHFHRPVIPVGSLYWDELMAATDSIIHFKKTPQEALDDVTVKLQAALEKALEKVGDIM